MQRQLEKALLFEKEEGFTISLLGDNVVQVGLLTRQASYSCTFPLIQDKQWYRIFVLADSGGTVESPQEALSSLLSLKPKGLRHP